MRAYNFAAAAVLVASSGIASAAVQDVHTHRFDNGLTLHVSPGHASPVVAVQAWVGVGSADEPAGMAGVAHVVEHMLFKGSSDYGLGELTRAIEHGGGEINAWTAFDHTVYHAVLGSQHVDGAVAAIGDALLSPRVEPEELAREREVIIEEIRHGSDDPARSVAQSLFATAFVAHPYRRPVIGTVDSVRRLRERELVEFFRSYYVADNLTLVVAGDVDPDHVRRSVERRFRAMPSGRPARVVTAEPKQTRPRASATLRDVSEAYLSVGFHVPSARHPDLAALDVAALLLGQTASARLPTRLRDDEIATSAYANVHALRDPGLFVLSATSEPSRAQNAVGALVDRSLELIEDLASDELDKARIAAESSFVRQLETAQGRARSLGWHATVAGDPQFAHVYLDRIRGVRKHDVAQAMHRYLRPDNASVAAILPTPKRKGRGTRAETFSRVAEQKVQKALSPATAPSVPVEKRVVLPNGLVLLVRRDPTVPVVAMRAVWRGGQRLEDDKTAGFSSLLSRMITRGCGSRDGAAVADQIDRLGGALGGVTGRNSFGVSAEWLARTWQPGLDLLADCILAPSFDTDELAKERRLMLEDQLAQNDSPAQLAFRTFSEALYGAHPYARDGLGTPASIDGFTRQKLLSLYRAQYPVSQMTLAIVGDAEPDDVIAAVNARFAKVTAPSAPAAVAITPPVIDGRSATDREVYRYLSRAQAHLVVGYPGATVDASDRFALEVLVAILGGQSGRLFSELREKRGLVYRVSAHSVEGVDPGFVAVYLSCAPEKLGEALSVVRGELSRVVSDGITPEELSRAQSYLIGSHQIAMQRRSAIANALAYHEAYGLGWKTWMGYDDAIRAVTPAAVLAAAAKYLRPDRQITATVQPPVATPAAAKKSKLAVAPPRTAPPPKKRKARGKR
ncbi:MAG TPA: pitrilysin family protein [Kofleriaceae bacterium]